MKTRIMVMFVSLGMVLHADGMSKKLRLVPKMKFAAGAAGAGGAAGTDDEAAEAEWPVALQRCVAAGGGGDEVNERCLPEEFLKTVTEGEPDAVKRYLVQGSIDINQLRNSTHHNALHIAAIEGHESLVELFLNNGADPNVLAGITGASALLFAVWHCHPKIVQLLLDRGAGRDIFYEGKIPLQWAQELLEKEPKDNQQRIAAFETIIKHLQ